MPAWARTHSHLRRLSSPPKHQLADPALAARLLGIGAGALLQQENVPVGPAVPCDGTLLGGLFESLVTLDVRVYAQAAEARVGHLRTAAGEHEIDLIVERGDVIDVVVIGTDPYAYRREDGIAVVPAALLGP